MRKDIRTIDAALREYHKVKGDYQRRDASQDVPLTRLKHAELNQTLLNDDEPSEVI